MIKKISYQISLSPSDGQSHVLTNFPTRLIILATTFFGISQYGQTQIHFAANFFYLIIPEKFYIFISKPSYKLREHSELELPGCEMAVTQTQNCNFSPSVVGFLPRPTAQLPPPMLYLFVPTFPPLGPMFYGAQSLGSALATNLMVARIGPEKHSTHLQKIIN